ncbi:MAG TPA: lipase family protein, partial [Phycicoccus sp.]|nr:lipase family protein [Phycicoccus sp.]
AGMAVAGRHPPGRWTRARANGPRGAARATVVAHPAAAPYGADLADAEASPGDAGRGDGGRRPVPRWLSGLLGATLLVVGGWLAVRPFASLAVLLGLVAVGLLAAAVAEVADRPGDGASSRWRYVRAAAYLLGAVGVVVFTGLGVRAVILAIGVALVVGGVLDLLEARGARGVERWNSGLGGIASVAFGLLSLAWPDVSVVVVGVVLGIRLVILGMRLLGRALAGRRGAVADGSSRSGGGRAWLRLAGNALALLLAVVLVLVSFVIRRGAPTPDAFYTAPASVPAEPGRLLRAEPYTREIPAGASAWRILYTTTRDEGRPAVASALVVVPTDRARDGLPVIAWAHGTTGAAPGCAPTVVDPFEAGAFFVLDDVLARGWAYVGTDYVGLGTAGPHPYLVGQGEGRSVLDSVRAAHHLDGVVLGDDTVVWGHSQGGHAALWTGALAPTYAPDLTIDGIAALAPATNLPALVEGLGDVTGGELFASYVIDSYSRIYPDVTYRQYVRPGARPIVRAMAGRCLADVPNTLVSIGTLLALDKAIWTGDPARGPLGERLAENVPTGRIEAPLLIGQGGADSLVVPSAQLAYVEQRCAAGQALDYRVYPGLDHVPLVEAQSPAVRDLLEWTQARLDEDAPADTCPGPSAP